MITMEYKKDDQWRITWLEHYAVGKAQGIIRTQVKALLAEETGLIAPNWNDRWKTLKKDLKEIFWSEDPDQYQDPELEINNWFAIKVVNHPKAILGRMLAFDTLLGKAKKPTNTSEYLGRIL